MGSVTAENGRHESYSEAILTKMRENPWAARVEPMITAGELTALPVPLLETALVAHSQELRHR